MTALDMMDGSVETNCPYTRCDTCQQWVYPHCVSCESPAPRKCALCRRGAAEIVNAKDTRAKICAACDASWNREWRIGEVAAVAPGNGMVGRMVTLCAPPKRLDGSSGGDLYDHNGCLWAAWMDGTSYMLAAFEPWWLSPVPTLRKWFGDRVSELGRWADVLREQPVPAGEIRRWEWVRIDSAWQLAGHLDGGGYITMIVPCALQELLVRERWWRDQLQMALFTRHPDVKPEPKRAAFPWDPYPEVV